MCSPVFSWWEDSCVFMSRRGFVRFFSCNGGIFYFAIDKFSNFTRSNIGTNLAMDNMRRIIICWVGMMLMSLSLFAQKDFFGFQSLSLGDETYQLKWSAKTRNGRVMEEFIRPKDNLAKFEKKVVLELSNSGKIKEDEVKNQMADLAVMKEQSIVFSFDQLESKFPDEIWLEYTQGNVQGGKPFVLEWNFCRYKSVGDRVVLFRFRHRYYDTKEESFTKTVNKNRNKWMEEIVSFQIPDLKEK